MREERNYMVLITVLRGAHPVRAAADVGRQLGALTETCGESAALAAEPILLTDTRYVLYGLRRERRPGDLNVYATELSPTGHIYGDAVLMRYCLGEYIFMTKKEAQAISDVINLLA